MRTLLCWLLLMGTANAGTLSWDYDLSQSAVIPSTATVQRGPAATGPFTTLATIPSLPSSYPEPVVPTGWLSVYYRIHNDGGDSNVAGYVVPVVTPPPSTSTKFILGDRVVANGTGVYVRTSPSFASAGVVLPTGSLGNVIGGPTFAENYWWWKVLYDAGPEGWSTEPNIDKAVSVPPPPPPPPPPPTTTLDIRVSALEPQVASLQTQLAITLSRLTAVESKLAGLCRAAKAMGGSATSLAGRLRSQVPCP